MAIMLAEFAGFFGDTFHQDGRCVYADDRMLSAFSTRPEQVPVASGSTTSRYTPSVFGPDGKRTDLTVDLDADAVKLLQKILANLKTS